MTDTIFTRIITADIKKGVLDMWDAVLTGPDVYHEILNKANIPHLFIKMKTDGSNDEILDDIEDIDQADLKEFVEEMGGKESEVWTAFCSPEISFIGVE